jgi:hypothetical protein
LLSLLMDPSLPFACLGGSLLLSCIAVFVPLRRPDSVLANGRHVSGRPRWPILILACLIAIFGAGYIAAHFLNESRGEQKVIALLGGDPNIHINRLQIDYQQRRVICVDPEVLRYIEERFRNADPERNGLGTTYSLSLSFEGGGAKSFATYWSDYGDFSIYVGATPGEGGKGHGITLQHPRPQSIEELVEFLRKDYRKIAGTVLILEPGGSRVERDGTLVAE